MFCHLKSRCVLMNLVINWLLNLTNEKPTENFVFKESFG